MFTTRLTPEVEAQLEHHAKSTGYTKNQIANKAIAEYLKAVDLNTMKLAGTVQESEFHRYVRRNDEQQKNYGNAHELAHWISTNVIWTASARAIAARSSALSSAIYGRNVIVGFTDSFKPDGENCDGELYVISRNLASTGLGTDGYHLYVTKYQNWMDYMERVQQISRG